jgi:hypothetical protein
MMVRYLNSVMKAMFNNVALVKGANMFPSLGKSPVHGVDAGMQSAGIQLLGTLEPRQYERKVQYDTAKNVRMTLGADWDVSVESKDWMVVIHHVD